MIKVFLLQHVREMEDTGHEESKLTGVYSTKQKAEEAQAQLSTQPGFKDYPNCFEIVDHTLDRTSWTEGFVTVQPGEDDPKLH
jgi:hypothetical protein